MKKQLICMYAEGTNIKKSIVYMPSQRPKPRSTYITLPGEALLCHPYPRTIRLDIFSGVFMAQLWNKYWKVEWVNENRVWKVCILAPLYTVAKYNTLLQEHNLTREDVPIWVGQS
jgi:hypothetical protein